MTNNDEFAGKTQELEGSAREAVGEVTGDNDLKAAGAVQKEVGKSLRLLDRLRSSLLAVGSPIRGTNAVADSAVREAPGTPEELIEEPSSRPTDEVVRNAARWSRRRDVPLAILAWAGVVILILWAIGHVIGTVLLLVIAALLAYALAPAVAFLERLLPRFLAIIIVYLVVLGGIGGLLYLIIRTATDQISSLSGYVGQLLAPGTAGHPSQLEQTLQSFGISSTQIASLRDQLITRLEGLAGNVVPILTGIVSGTLDVILVTVLSIYLLIDGSRISGWVRRNVPRRQSGRVRFLMNTLQRIVGGYIRGQLLLCGLIGVLVGVGMGIIGVPYALLLGVLAFVLEFIPVLGVLASGAICVLLALTKGWLIALIVLVYFVVVHVIEGDVVGPRIVGKAVGLHPIVSLAALIAGGELFGIWGALLASPVAGVLQALLIAIWSEWREMHPQDFQAAKNKVAEKIEEHVADKTLDPSTDEPEPEAKLLS